MDIYKVIMDLLDTSAVQAIIVAVGGWLIAKLFQTKPDWEKYRGFILHGVKLAEKAIPDDVENRALRRLDMACMLAVRAIESSQGNVTNSIRNAIREGVSVVHEELEARKALPFDPELPLMSESDY